MNLLQFDLSCVQGCREFALLIAEFQNTGVIYAVERGDHGLTNVHIR